MCVGSISKSKERNHQEGINIMKCKACRDHKHCECCGGAGFKKLLPCDCYYNCHYKVDENGNVVLA